MKPLWKLTYHYPDETLNRTIFVPAITLEEAKAEAKNFISSNIIITEGYLFY